MSHVPRIGFMQGRLCAPVDGKVQAFPWEDWQAEFVTAQALEFDLMEWTIDQDRLRENPLMTADGQQRIRELREATGVDILSVTGDCFMQAPFYKESGPSSRELLRDLSDVLQASSRLGIRHVLMPLVDNGSLASAEQERSLRDGLLPLRPMLTSAGLKILFELDLEPARAATFIDAFPGDAFGVNYDVGNSAALGFDTREEVAAYGHRIDNVHVKDRELNGTTVPPGTGNARFDRTFGALKQAGYSGNLILQTARDGNGEHGRALDSYRRMTRDWWASGGA
ncbi:MAG TPA: TIM barrel protein [Solirubrobacteraceae bacterium]|nr:TIM barrel protein [Solirubrobacteraceae bacterium]